MVPKDASRGVVRIEKDAMVHVQGHDGGTWKAWREVLFALG